ncbi:MAG: hypothetical protein AAF990_04170 [Bacteroidota bacterium]
MKKINCLILINIFSLCVVITSYAQPCGGGDDRGGFGCALVVLFGGEKPTPPGDPITIPRVHAVDPNEISGPLGYDTAQWVSINDRLGYTIFYENDPAFATAPAQIVEVRLPVHVNLNVFSVRIGAFGFGAFNFEVPENTTFYQERLDVRDSLNVFVDVTAGIDVVTNEVFWIFESIDPLTGLPPEDALTGFLPVNDTTTLYNDTLPKRGEGYVKYSIVPRAGLMTGDSVKGTASIVFDENAPIITNTWENLVDAFGPVSQIDTVFKSGREYRLKWSGVDDVGGTGIAHYDLYVSKDDGPFLAFEEQIDTTCYTYSGAPGSTYAFYIISTDNVGNREEDKNGADAYVLIGDKIQVAAKVLLQGPYDGGSGLLRDNLRDMGLIPLSEPYTALGFTHVGEGGGEAIDASILTATGNDAIVDWVFLELRDKQKADSVLATRSALLQADGDIVDVDGLSAVGFSNLVADDYYLAVRHRNHLGIRSANPLPLGSDIGTLVDFTNTAFATFGNRSQVDLSGVLALYSGNANQDGQVNAVDKNAYWRPQNGQPFDYLIFTADFNLDGNVNAVDKNLYWRVNNSVIEQLD